MKKPIANIGILLLLIIVLPPLFFTSYEIGNYYRNEQMIDSIYTSQLESVIFSINQYSDDIVSGWANQIEANILNSQPGDTNSLDGFIQNNISVELIFLTDTTTLKSIHSKGSIDLSGESIADSVEHMLSTQQSAIRRLIQYKDAGYRKIQPVDVSSPGKSLFLFAYQRSPKEKGICGILVNTGEFIQENLGPKIQSVAQDKFYLSVFKKDEDAEMYSNELFETADKNIEHKMPLWLMPDYELGIQLKGETIEDLVRERMRLSIWLIVIMDLVLILAAYFVYRSVRQQMKLAQLKSDFVSNVSHEIRTPLAIINMYSETLEMGRIKDEEKKKEYYQIINTETNRLSGIVNKILNFSKIESGQREYKFVETRLDELIGQILENYQHHFSTKKIRCTFHSVNEPHIITIDPDAVTDAVINLIDNAIKYGGEKKQIDIATGQDGGMIFIEVKDYGLVIEEKYHKLIFDKFYRVTKGNLAHEAKGSGIGLSIVKHIMTAHNGTVTLKSTPGEGSRFRLNFPTNLTTGR